ncbi:MAG TPA: peptide-methionine (R)-S-oxide reductase MsrB [Tianweitania sediminis]|jgi:peptide-methionine (R)-S-oxide reductase|nr:peptide-methionine (R)-S-oxide reductase MsrB [Tianweitania sediminis]
MQRRDFLYSAAGAAVLAATGTFLFSRTSAKAASEGGAFPVTKTAAEWRAQLTPQQYAVLREEDTERAFTSPLNKEHRVGMFHCAGCDQAVYSSDKKFDSGTGWPSFWDAVPGGIGTKEDNTFFMTRTECHCARCGGHLGHIFNDGPQPTGMRHCINGVAMTFKPSATQSPA